jgi:hypothetical protein
LINLNLDGCCVHPNTRFSGATFIGDQRVVGATFAGPIWFRRATFTGETTFDDAVFTSRVPFSGATFAKKASFANVTAPNGFEMNGARATLAGDHKWPPGWSLHPNRPAATPNQIAEGWGALRESIVNNPPDVAADHNPTAPAGHQDVPV